MTRRVAIGWLVVIALIAVGADCVAADRPIVYERAGEWHVLPGVRDVGPRGNELRGAMGPTDWALWPPIARDPVDVRTAGRIEPLHAPSDAHLMGTDDRGRDVAARLIHGTRTSLCAAAIATVIALLFAIVVALVAVRVGGTAEVIVLAMCDVLAAAPALLGVIAVGGLTGARGVGALAVLVAIPRGADTARLVVASLRATLAEPFVLASRAAGASPARVLVRHALPHATAVIAAAAAVTAATTILAEAALSFLGLGAAPPTPAWGELLAQASANDLRWWLMWPAGLAITATAAALLRLARR
jgi:peptide/nickel transport system permease protein